MGADGGVLEVFYPADDNAVYLGANLLGSPMGVWSPYCSNGRRVIVAGGSNDLHHNHYHIMNESHRERPVTILLVDQHMDHEIIETWPSFGIMVARRVLGFNEANFMGDVEKLDNVDQVIYLGVATHVPSTHPHAIDKYYLTGRIGDLFIYASAERTPLKPDFDSVTPKMLQDPFSAMLVEVLRKEVEQPTVDHRKSTLFLPPAYSQRKRALGDIGENPSIKSYERNMDTVTVQWKHFSDFDPAVIRNDDVWISLDYDVFDEAAGVQTRQDFGKAPYDWFCGLVGGLDSHDLRGFDYWGFELDRMGPKTLGRIRDTHEMVKGAMEKHR